MRIRFIATENFPAYRGWHDGERLIFSPGEEKDVAEAKAEELLKDFPGNFVRAEASGPISNIIEAAPADRMFKRTKARKKQEV